MAPTPSSKSTPHISTPLFKSNQTHQVKTPQSRNRLNFNLCKPSPNPSSAAAMKENNSVPAEHPVEVIGRIRDHPDEKKKPVSVSVSALQTNPDGKSLRVKTDIGYRDFSLDGISLSEEEGLDEFYKKFVQSRILGVKLGDKCTIMMYGPTGAGKSHTMFGCAKQPGIVYRSLKDILGEGEELSEGNGEKLGPGTFVQVTVLEIYNEEIYDLLPTNTNGGGSNFGWPKGGSASKVRLEVMGKKAKNATYIAGYDAIKISKEIQKVEKRRIVKSTLCNERSSRSHCMIILDVPTVGGRLMLVDMAGSENIEQAGQIGFEAKMQTAKINQGNIALKRVVESIANGDSHVPFRDSKLTMLLQDSFEDDKSKILMILCASPDPKELHKTISTLEYGAKAKCIIRGPHTPTKEKGLEDTSSAAILGTRIAAMDQFICKLQMENKLREKELLKKEEEISALRAKLTFSSDLDKKIQECQKKANEHFEMERKMENILFQQQQQVEMLRQRLMEIESEVCQPRVGGGSLDIEGSNFARKLLETYSEDPGMVKSMDLDKSYDLDVGKRDVIMVYKAGNPENHSVVGLDIRKNSIFEEDNDIFVPSFPSKLCLSTVFEEEEEDSVDDKEQFLDEEVQKEVIEEKKVVCSSSVDIESNPTNIFYGDSFAEPPQVVVASPDISSKKQEKVEDMQDTSASRQLRIQNIFTLCGNYRELSQHCLTPMPERKLSEDLSASDNLAGNYLTPVGPKKVKTLSFENTMDLKENHNPLGEKNGDLDVYVKWEASRDNPGKLITTLKVAKESTLADLRKLIEIYMGADNQSFTFTFLGLEVCC
ncbi:OLC1v1019662C2 [Oldenlandia corymbosa var. corymbosa]|uniref:Kinesin-like protein KIN-10A n=1 Tax=Oldenlandia corymbosa var. corymbosa TaxID=529605 RepID=A0AAV1EEL1_OLDCO|nr:OLC1v1019662C2 [Oldenlandia corymbosa var. corymbosa]